MAIPVSEQIAVKVKTRLGLITTGAGYEQTITGVHRPAKVAQFHPENYQIVVTQESNTVNEELSHPGNPPAKARDLTFAIAGMLRISDTDTSALDTFRNVFEADIEKAITVDAAWWNWDSLAINSTIGDIETYQDTEGNSGFKVPLVVTYRTDENNPYNVRA